MFDDHDDETFQQKRGKQLIVVSPTKLQEFNLARPVGVEES